MDTILNLLSLLGSLALFLYGMKIMSEGLQKFAGDRLRNVLAAMTKNRVMGVLTGILITAVIQSSSATTVMVVSFVNAGLMTLQQSIGVIMGANIGTTVTAWIISFIGFKVSISDFALPLLAFGVLLIFSAKSSRKSIGEFIFGFSFLFMGLNMLQEAAEKLNIGDFVASGLVSWAGTGFFSIIIYVIVGTVVTMIVQASAATMAITLMLFSLHIDGFGFEQAAALAMGQNIGTTITANLAAMTANTQARRAALAHLLFNVFGVIVILFIFQPFCDVITWIVRDICHQQPVGDQYDMYRLSAFHTAFNIFNTMILIWFVKTMELVVCKILPTRESEEEYRLRYISGGLMNTAELSILEARKEIGLFAERTRKMFAFVQELLHTAKDEDFNKLFSRIEKYENISDNMEVEIADYLNKVAEGRLSSESKTQIQSMLREVTEIESIGDSCYNLARTMSRKRNHSQEEFTEQQFEHIRNMMTLDDEALEQMVNVVEHSESQHVDINRSYNIEHEINNYRNQLKEQNIVNVNKKLYDYQMGVYYMDIIAECEKLGDYVINVIEATGVKEK